MKLGLHLRVSGGQRMFQGGSKIDVHFWKLTLDAECPMKPNSHSRVSLQWNLSMSRCHEDHGPAQDTVTYLAIVRITLGFLIECDVISQLQLSSSEGCAQVSSWTSRAAFIFFFSLLCINYLHWVFFFLNRVSTEESQKENLNRLETHIKDYPCCLVWCMLTLPALRRLWHGDCLSPGFWNQRE